MWKLSGAAAITCSLVATTSVPSIYQCFDPQGTPRFAQYPCGEDARVIEIDEPSVITRLELTDAEQRTLDRISREHAKNRQAQARSRKSARRRDAHQRLRQADACLASRATLDALRGQKRRGYALGEAGVLQAEEARLREQIAKNC